MRISKLLDQDVAVIVKPWNRPVELSNPFEPPSCINIGQLRPQGIGAIMVSGPVLGVAMGAVNFVAVFGAWMACGKPDVFPNMATGFAAAAIEMGIVGLAVIPRGDHVPALASIAIASTAAHM